jgi:hypothetical protein
VYGSIFAPRQELAAQELYACVVRAERSGWRIGRPKDSGDRPSDCRRATCPPPAGLRGAPEWGTEQRLRELFGDAVTSTQIERKSALFRFRSPQHWIEVFSTYFGPIMRTLEALDAERRRAYLADLDATLRRFNRSGDETLVVSADYLEVVMIKK